MKTFRLTALALALVSTSSMAEISFALPSTNTTIKIGGYFNAGTHQRRGDRVDWDNMLARQSAADYYQATAGNPSSTPGNITAAKAQYDKVVAANPYWENLNTSASDIYFRLRLAAEQQVSSDLKVFGFFERDFRTKRDDFRGQHVTDGDDDVTRRAFIGLEGDFGQLRFGRDESAMDYVRDLLYLPIEKDHYEYHVLVQPISAMGRHDNSVIYRYDTARFGITAGAAFKSQEDFVSESSHSISARYVALPGLTFAAGYVGGELKTDTEGSIIQPNLNFMGLSAWDVSQVFEAAAYNPRFKLDQRQANIGVSYASGPFSIGATVFRGRYKLGVNGEDVNRAGSATASEFDTRGGQASVRYAVNDKLSVAALYTRSKNTTTDFSLVDVASLAVVYNLTPQALLYGSVGRDSSDAAKATVGNVGIRFGF